MADLTHEELVERVAEHIWGAENPHGLRWAKVSEVTKGPTRRAARAAISTIAEALREPTEEMMMAMIYAKKLMWPIVGQVLTVEYRAAIAASPLHGAKK